MSRGTQLQEMEVGTKQSKTAVNAGAKPAEPMDTSVAASYEDLGGPTPENYRPDDDSAKLKTPGGSLKQVRDVVNKGAKAAEPMKGMKEEDEFDGEEVIEEDAIEEEVEEVEEETTEVDIEEDVNALLGGEELSEEFKEKAKVIFEAAINAKITEIKNSLEEQHAAALAEEVEEVKEELAERVDSYLEYVADEWFNENALVVEQALKAEMTESFLHGLKGLFEDHYVSIPEDKYDVLESMVEKLDDMETKLNEQIEKNISLNKRLAESVADGILDQVSEGLAQTQKEKLASLAESVEFESEETYREKLETLKESYFASKPASPSAKTETLSEGVDSSPEFVSDSMSAYLRTLGSFSK
jgi:hypothetical protein